ncbi:MAG: 16S rRNA (cytidine(1402)-2'-O)-methyltransferase [Actinobacteria bacterium]|nr:16S rRNA (cytidine(1402)-2'-O)-methyltransferase [Actinomycetota bacterium]
MSSTSGRLVLVGTPIGNLGDLAPRAVAALAAVDVVACEDTRRTGRLLQHAGVVAPRLLRLDEHTEVDRIGEILGLLADGRSVALCSDAGMPGVSDPGERLVRAVTAAGHPVEVVPGPSASLTALVGSGLPTGRFCFEGFLPRRGGARTARLAALAAEERTVVLFEAPHRVARTLGDLVVALGAEREVTIARELTKLHEEWWRGSLEEAVERVAAVEPRGEHVLVVAGAEPSPDAGGDEIDEAVRAEIASGRSLRDAAAVVARRLGVPRRTVYERALRADDDA